MMPKLDFCQRNKKNANVSLRWHFIGLKERFFYLLLSFLLSVVGEVIGIANF